MLFFLFIISIILLNHADVVDAIGECSTAYCVCLGECPESYESAYKVANSISNGEHFICYASNGAKFTIGGNTVLVNGGDTTTIRMHELAPCVQYHENAMISTTRSYDVPVPVAAAVAVVEAPKETVVAAVETPDDTIVAAGEAPEMKSSSTVPEVVGQPVDSGSSTVVVVDEEPKRTKTGSFDAILQSESDESGAVVPYSMTLSFFLLITSIKLVVFLF